MKKAIILAMCLILVGLLAVNSTLAQGILDLFRDMTGILKDKDALPEQNTERFDMQLLVQKRGPAGTGLTAEDTLPAIYPAMYPADFDWDNDKTLTDGYLLWDSSKLMGAVDKFVSVTETMGRANYGAYVRTVFALDAYAWQNDLIHLNFNRDPDNFEYSDWLDTTIGGRPFKMIVVTYLHELDGSVEATPPMLLQVAMSNKTTSEDRKRLGTDFLQYTVLGMEAKAFRNINDSRVGTAKLALDEALPIDSSFHPFQ